MKPTVNSSTAFSRTFPFSCTEVSSALRASPVRGHEDELGDAVAQLILMAREVTAQATQEENGRSPALQAACGHYPFKKANLSSEEHRLLLEQAWSAG